MASGRRSDDKWGSVVVVCHLTVSALIVVLVLLKIVVPKIFLQQNWNIIIPMALFYLPNAFSFRLDKTNKKAL